MSEPVNGNYVEVKGGSEPFCASELAGRPSFMADLMAAGDLPPFDHPEDALDWAKTKKVLADAEKVRIEAIRARAGAIRQLIEACRLLFKLTKEEREWVVSQLSSVDR